MKFLKSQINPHFLFNALNNIYALSISNAVKTQKSIASLSEMLRYVLYECDQPKVSIKKEVAYIQNYLELFSLKSSKAYNIETDFQLTNENLQIAPMILIPFIENALKHGHLEKRGNSFLKISLHTENLKVWFEVENSIPELPLAKDDVGGIGLENVKKRLGLLYPEQHSLDIQNNLKTFKVVLKLELDGKD